MKVATIVFAVLVIQACAVTSSPGSVNEGEVRIVRDEFGVPHIYADSVYGLYYGYGYAIAQDRLFQMEMARRSTQGTVAEAYGADFLDYDKNVRMLFSPSSIHEQIAALQQKDKDVFAGYAAGINAWLAKIRDDRDRLTPKQFNDLDLTPSEWTAYDVAMIFIGTMNNRYGDFNTELENASILASLAEQHGKVSAMQIFNLLNPRFTDDGSTTIPVEDWSRTTYDSLAIETAQNIPGRVLPLVALNDISSGFSNCFVIGRDKVKGGGAILVNGPQFGWFNPSYVYSVGLHGAGVNVAGNSPFGYPMIMFGHNETISWGSTWGASDIVDIFTEKLDPENPRRYWYKGEYRDFEHRVEQIVVKGAGTFEHDVFRSVHGPIIRVDEKSGDAYAKKRAWDGSELDTLLSWLYATWASDFDEWKAQAEKSAINVNMYFADVEGNIGYFHGGQFPQRAAGHDNRFPVVGDGSMDWQGRQAVERANPHVLNPSTGFLANWNNKPGQGVMNPDFFFYSWSSADRNNYLQDRLSSQQMFNADEAWDILEGSSYTDVFAPYFLALINAAVANSDEPELRGANKTLQSWSGYSRDDDGDGRYDEAATGLFRAFIDSLIVSVLKDDLGAAYPYFSASGYPTAERPTGAGTNLQTGVKAVVEAFEGDQPFDVLNGETVQDVILAALRVAVGKQDGELLPVATRPFSTSNFLGVPQAGSDEQMLAPIEQNRGTENNMMIMRPGAIVGWEVAPPGQSAFVAPDGTKSPHYDDQFKLYQRFGRKRVWFYPKDVEAHAQSELRLTY